jgi:PAS domain S-box-containing protein
MNHDLCNEHDVQGKEPRRKESPGEAKKNSSTGYIWEDVTTLALLESLAQAIIVVDKSTRILYVNKLAEGMFGYQSSDLVGKSHDILVPDRFRATHGELMAGYFSEPRNRMLGNGMDLYGRHRNGSEFPVDISLSYLMTKIGTVSIALVTDLTLLKQSEQALRLSERRYRSFVEVTSQYAWRTDPNGLVTEDIPTLREFTGQTYEETKGSGWTNALYPDDVKPTLEVWQRAIETRTSYETEYRMRRYDGMYRLLLARGVPVFDEQGQVVEWVGTCIDITERKQAENALRESEERLKKSQEIAHLGSWELDVIHDHLTWSDEVYRIFGLQPQEFGATYEAFLLAVHPDDRQKVDTAYSSSLNKNSGGYEIEHRIVNKSTGEIRIVHEKCFHVRDGSGRIVRSIGMIHDITDRKRMEETIQRQLKELAATNSELESFSYSVAHDLRSPLRVIKGFGSIIIEDYSAKLDSEMRGYFDLIVKTADKMDELITDMLSLAKISRQEINPQEIDMSAMVGSILDELHHADPERKVEASVAPGIKAFGDERLIHIALSNLIGNAWKYSSKTPDAQIEFGIQKKNGDQVYYIRDNGAGFDMAYAEKLFTPFKRLHSDKEFPGTGIGLAIVNRVIERHRGRIWAESETGKGATFYFTLLL